jgi:hypothetical protein
MLMIGVDVLLVARMAGTSVAMIERVYGHFRNLSYSKPNPGSTEREGCTRALIWVASSERTISPCIEDVRSVNCNPLSSSTLPHDSFLLDRLILEDDHPLRLRLGGLVKCCFFPLESSVCSATRVLRLIIWRRTKKESHDDTYAERHH